MRRRDIIKYTALATGVALSAPLILSLTSCKAELHNNYIPTYFSEAELSKIANLVDIILPKTDSPAGTEVGVHQMIDQMVANVYKPDEQESYRKCFDALIKYCSSQTDFETAVKNVENAKSDDISEYVKGYRNLKQQTVSYYLTSEQVMTNHLNYIPVPGEFKACIDVKEVGNIAWAI